MDPPAKVTDGLLGVLAQKSGAEAGKKVNGFERVCLSFFILCYSTSTDHYFIGNFIFYKLTCLKMLLSFE